MGLPNTFADNCQIHAMQLAMIPDLANSGQIQGVADWIDVRQFQHVTILHVAEGGTAGNDPTYTLRQATDATGAGAKALNFGNRLWYKDAANLGALGTAPAFTKLTGNDGNNTYAGGAAGVINGENDQIVLIDFDTSLLDVSNGFNHIEFSIADLASTAKLSCTVAILTWPRYAQAAGTMKSDVT